MKYAITKRDAAILIGLFGILCLAAVYYFVYLGYKDKTAALKGENDALQSRVDVLQSISDQQTELVETTKSNNESAEKIMERFPSNIYEEDIILFTQSLQEFAPFEAIPSIGIGAPAQAYAFEDIKAQTDEEVRGYIPGESSDEDEEGGENGEENGEVLGQLPSLFSRGCTISGSTDYDGLKNAIRFIVDNDERCNMVISANYDISTGMLVANINYSKYFVTGTDKPYIEPDIFNVVQGTDNIFGTIPLTELRPRSNATTRTFEGGAGNNGAQIQ